MLVRAGVAMGPVWAPAAVGAAVGAGYAALNRAGMKRFWRAPHSPLNVVVTGGSRGLGKAMAREFLRCAHNSHAVFTQGTQGGACQLQEASRARPQKTCGMPCAMCYSASMRDNLVFISRIEGMLRSGLRS